MIFKVFPTQAMQKSYCSRQPLPTQNPVCSGIPCSPLLHQGHICPALTFPTCLWHLGFQEAQCQRLFRVLSHQVPCPILLWAHILHSFPLVTYIFLHALLVFDIPGHIELQLKSNIHRLTSAGTMDKVSALLPADLFLLPLPNYSFLCLGLTRSVHYHSCRTSDIFIWLPLPWNGLILLGR